MDRQAPLTKLICRLAKSLKPYRFPWTSLSCSLSSVCTSLLHICYPNSHLCPSSALKYKWRNAGPRRIPNMIVFFSIFVFSLVGAIGLAARTASRKGKGLCEDFGSGKPVNCTRAAVAMTFAWISVVIGTPSTSLVSYMVDLTIHQLLRDLWFHGWTGVPGWPLRTVHMAGRDL